MPDDAFAMLHSTTRWSIEIRAGAGALRFGMPKEKVARLISDNYPLEKTITSCEMSFEYRNKDTLRLNYYRDELFHIMFVAPFASVFIRDQNIFASDPKAITRMLYHANGGASSDGNILRFENLGIGLDGFFRKDKGFYLTDFDDGYDGRAFSIFSDFLYKLDFSSFSPLHLNFD